MDAADAKLLAERVAAGEVPPDELARAAGAAGDRPWLCHG